MSRALSLFARLPTLPVKMTEAQHWTPLRDLTDLLATGAVQRNLFVGGSENIGIPAEATGDVTLYGFAPWSVDNTSSQISGFVNTNGGTLVVQVRFLVRVSNAAINVTPKIFYGSTMGSITTAATVSGTAACAATASDYSGTNQIQTVTLTLPAGLKYFKPALTIAGATAVGYQVWGRAYYDAYVSLP
jgi:hypothetical protein